MTSTKNERVAKAKVFLHTLIGDQWNYRAVYYRRPSTLPTNYNYLMSEWNIINDVIMRLHEKKDVSIQLLFAMEEMENKYRDPLMLAKLMN